MKRLLILALVLACAPLWADGGWDLTKPADNGYVASFPTEVRANQAAIVASLTPPIEWTGEGSDTYGTASVKLGFTDVSGYPLYWLGSLGEGVGYIFGPRDAVPTAANGWTVLVASGGMCFARIGMPTTDGSAAAGDIDVFGSLIDLGGRQIRQVATGTSDHHAVNVGQMNAAITNVLVIANMSDGTGVDFISWGNYALATFTYETIDTHSAWDGATFTAPLDGIYEVGVYTPIAISPAHTSEVTVTTQFFTDSNKLTKPASAPIYLSGTVVATGSSLVQNSMGSAFLPMNKDDTFVILHNSSPGGTSVTVRLQDARLYIHRIADLP